MMKKLGILSLSILLNACGGLRSPESIDEKMRRYQGNEEKFANKADLPVIEYQFKGRQIASVGKTKKSSFDGYSNKRIYFLTLMSQYNRLRTLSSAHAPKIESCPSFHTAVVNNRFMLNPMGKSKKKLGDILTPVGKTQLKDSQFVAKNPIYALPVTQADSRPNLADILSSTPKAEYQNWVQKAFSSHLHRNYQELKKLCDKGVSDDYYIFENLATYFTGEMSGARNKKGVKTLMKTNIFFNMAMQKSLGLMTKTSKKSGRSLASAGVTASEEFNAFEVEVFDRLGVDWSKEYFQVFE